MHGIDIPHHFVIRKSNNADSSLKKSFGSGFIVCLSARVRISVYLDSQKEFRTVKINNIFQ